jgi:succinate dehydrogenase / fumarate reductase cytochrome b subunit
MTNNDQMKTKKDILKWFDPRNRHVGTWAFILNRITALGLVIYLYLHLIVLSTLAQGPEAFDSFIEFAHQPWVVFGELLVVVAAIYHGLNGIRVGLTSFGIGVPNQKQLFYAVLVVAVVASIFFAVRMFTA